MSVPHPLPSGSYSETIAELTRALPSFEHQGLTVLAALGAPLNRTRFANLLRGLQIVPNAAQPASGDTGLRRKPGRAASSASAVTQLLKPIVERWERLGLVQIENGDYVCRGWVAHAVLSDPRERALVERLRSAWQATSFRDDIFGRANYDLRSALQHLRRVRIALYLHLPEEAEQLFTLAKAELNSRRVSVSELLRLLVDPRGPADPLSLLTASMRADYLRQVLPPALRESIIPSPEILQTARLLPLDGDEEVLPHAHALTALSGAAVSHDHEAVLERVPGRFALEVRALLSLQRGQLAEARARAQRALATKHAKGSVYARRDSPLMPLLTFLLATGEPIHAAAARAQVQQIARIGAVPEAYMPSILFLGEQRMTNGTLDTWTLLLHALALFFLDLSVPPRLAAQLTMRAKAWRQQGAHWLAEQTERVGNALQATPQERAMLAADASSLLALHVHVPAWQRGLTDLESLVTEATQVGTPAATLRSSDQRLVFEVRLMQQPAWSAGSDGTTNTHDPALPNWLNIAPRLQTRRGDGYTAGRPVSLRTLAEQAQQLDYLSDEDRAVVAQIKARRDWHGIQWELGPHAPVALIGHPRVFWSDKLDGSPLKVSARRATLHAAHSPTGLSLRVAPVANEHGVGVVRDGEDQLGVCVYSAVQLKALQRVAALPPIPREGADQLRQTLARLTGLFTVESDVGLTADAQTIETVAADSRPVIELSRAEPGLHVHVSVAPLGAAGPRYQPGAGASAVAAVLSGKRVGCQRDLDAERAALGQLLTAAPALDAALGGNQLTLDCLPVCLDLLGALNALGESVSVEWPHGDPISVVGSADLSSLSLDLEERQDWLEASGTLRLDEDRVLDLMAALSQRTQDGAYLELGTDRYLALSRELQAQLRALDAAATTAQGAQHPDRLRMAPVALGFVSPWLKALRAAGALRLDTRVAQQLARIEEAYATTPEPPRTFEVALRPYQQSGFEFLSRLASFGAGACLADDMGLGKTLMTLALLTARAPSGPALVVAPTSVRGNWFDEAQRFAPSLRMCSWDSPDSACPALEAFDVLVCSYNVMTQRIEQLERVAFSTVVLDEAQAIKNGATQRTSAARRLVGQARIALTGTPVENHLGDLHSIMSFLNPGLLGDAKHFEARFAKPIQRERDPRAHEQLKTLIAPFLLRRKKSEVLKELPERTEITLRVEPEPDEQAFTEALRRTALLRLAGGDGAAGTRSAISILAAITRLRRAACHPQLVDPQADVGAAKLERLVELAHELRDGGHRALVFSQFVDFLHIVRERLAAEGFSYQYLDGSTRESARRKAVADFQAGDGDAFLISLKAGGFGLNLTAADYVIHLDPWWNPAVEAQASDRAHRIGQTRPVTIYRLVNAASIEERVLALHEKKRDLAENVLSDSAEAARLDPKALLALLE